MKPNTLRVSRPSGNVFWATLFLLLFFAGIAEWFTRLDAFQAPLTPPKMGSRHYQLGHKLALLDAAVKKNGPVDCIVVGSSMVDVGFDPDLFQKSYQEITGREIRCFNFGIDASSVDSTAALVKILVEDYRPRLLILGTDARDYAILPDDRDPAAILETPWVRYRSGDFSLEGWLMEYSYFYRYRQHLSRLLRFNLDDTLWSETNLTFDILVNGYTPLNKVADYINDPPDPQDDSFEVAYNSRIFASFQVLDGSLASLESIMDRNRSGTQVIIVEMPVSDGLYFFFDNGELDYDRFITRVTELASLYQVPFWRTEPLDSIPDDGWSDYSHLNVKGAGIFSHWLGGRVAEAEQRGEFQNLSNKK